jgi:hypothetical protein
MTRIRNWTALGSTDAGEGDAGEGGDSEEIGPLNFENMLERSDDELVGS